MLKNKNSTSTINGDLTMFSTSFYGGTLLFTGINAYTGAITLESNANGLLIKPVSTPSAVATAPRQELHRKTRRGGRAVRVGVLIGQGLPCLTRPYPG